MDDKTFDSINVIPLVDVMLVLLTIVLTTSTFIATGAIPVELPKATAAATPQKSTTITIDKNGRIFLDGEVGSLSSLQAELDKRERHLPVLIRADRSIALQAFVEVMEVVKNLGFSKINLQTEVSG